MRGTRSATVSMYGLKVIGGQAGTGSVTITPPRMGGALKSGGIMLDHDWSRSIVCALCQSIQYINGTREEARKGTPLRGLLIFFCETIPIIRSGGSSIMT